MPNFTFVNVESVFFLNQLISKRKQFNVETEFLVRVVYQKYKLGF